MPRLEDTLAYACLLAIAIGVVIALRNAWLGMATGMNADPRLTALALFILAAGTACLLASLRMATAREAGEGADGATKAS